MRQWSHCGKGHAFTDKNTRIGPQGSQICKLCQSAIQAQVRARNKIHADRGYNLGLEAAAKIAEVQVFEIKRSHRETAARWPVGAKIAELIRERKRE